MSFDKLMEDLAVLAKSQAAAGDDAGGDDKIAAAAGDDAAAAAAAAAAEGAGGDDGAAAGGDDGGAADAGAAGGDDGAAGGDDEPLGKSFSFKLDDGTELEAIDGTQLVKALMQRVEGTEENLTKALGAAVDLLKSQDERLNSQGELIKSMQAQIAALSGEGRGRKTVVSVAERPTVLKKSEPEGISPNEFMAKCLQAQAAGKITGQDVSRAEAYLNRGLAVPAEIVARVAAQ